MAATVRQKETPVQLARVRVWPGSDGGTKTKEDEAAVHGGMVKTVFLEQKAVLWTSRYF